MNIRLISTPSDKIRAEQSGDWWLFPGNNHGIVVHVDDQLPPVSQLAIAIHELVEAYLCGQNGVNEDAVVAFDEHYEAERKQGKHGPDDEPGDDPAAPYRSEHMAATHVERAVCMALGITWQAHELSVQLLAADHPKTSSPEPQPSGQSEPPPQHALD